MPRAKREKSSTGIYHIIFRGINRQRIFEDEQDYQRFLQILEDVKKKSEYEIYGYCLMSNHVHLLMKEGMEELGRTFKRIGACYVYYYNWKYKRRGHLFQDRYKSEVVEDTGYFLSVLRYIHHNPVKAKIVKNLEDYPWSSYKEYLKTSRICRTDYGFSLFHVEPKQAKKLLIDFHKEINDDRCMEYDTKVRWQDHEVVEYLLREYNMERPKELYTMERGVMNKIFHQCKKEGMSIRQLERITGVSFTLIRNA